MMKTSLKIVFVLTLLAFAACAHHRDVRPGADGVNRVSVRAVDKEDAEQDAISQANHYCESVGDKHAAFVSEQTKYTGTMDEATRDTVRKASKAAQVLGTQAEMNRRASTPAGMGSGTSVHVGMGGADNPVGAAGTVGGIMTGGKDYLSEMSFKCQ